MPGLTLDAGALVAFERNDRSTVLLLTLARVNGQSLAIPAGVVAQVWRDGQRQARLAKLLASAEVEIEPLNEMRAREAGQLCGLRGTSDVIDASVILCARARGDRIVTSDIEDLQHLDPTVTLIRA